MIIWTLLFGIIHAALGTCPPGMVLERAGQCIGVGKLNTKYDTLAGPGLAKAICAEKGAHLPIIHNEQDQEFWREKATTPQLEPLLLLGLEQRDEDNSWQWIDGSIDYIPNDVTFNLYGKKPNKYPLSVAILSNGTWDYFQSNRTVDIYCVYDTPKPKVLFTECLDNICYDMTDVSNFKGASKACRQVGATLASVHNAKQNAFIRNMAVSRKYEGVYLGAHKNAWIDKTTWNFTHFSPSFPNLKHGSCLGMDTSDSEGKWVNVKCSEEHPYVCQQEKTPPISHHLCDGAAQSKPGDLIKSPGFPFVANVPCTFYFNVPKHKKVEVEIILLEANSCCDSLTIYEGTLGNAVIAKLTGEVSNKFYRTKHSSSMRLEWNPTDGKNVRGLLVKYRAV